MLALLESYYALRVLRNAAYKGLREEDHSWPVRLGHGPLGSTSHNWTILLLGWDLGCKGEEDDHNPSCMKQLLHCCNMVHWAVVKHHYWLGVHSNERQHLWYQRTANKIYKLFTINSSFCACVRDNSSRSKSSNCWYALSCAVIDCTQDVHPLEHSQIVGFDLFDRTLSHLPKQICLR